MLIWQIFKFLSEVSTTLELTISAARSKILAALAASCATMLSSEDYIHRHVK